MRFPSFFVVVVVMLSTESRPSGAFSTGGLTPMLARGGPRCGMRGMIDGNHAPLPLGKTGRIGIGGGRAPVCMSSAPEEEGGGGGIFGGLFGGLFGGGGANMEERDAFVMELTRKDGWDMKMTIGSEPARALGGTGSLAKGDSMTFQTSVGFRLDLDEGYDPPQGTAYVSGSTIFKETKEGGEMKGFWQVTDVLDDEVPSTISLSFKCPDGISVSGETVIPPGFLYANVRVKRKDGAKGIRMYDGRLTVKEDVKTAFLLAAYDSIIAEYKLVGTCEASPKIPAPDVPP